MDELQHAEKLAAEIETARKAHALAITAEQRERVQARAVQRLATMSSETAQASQDLGDQIVLLLDGGYNPTGEIVSSAESHDGQSDAGDRIVAELERSRGDVRR